MKETVWFIGEKQSWELSNETLNGVPGSLETGHWSGTEMIQLDQQSHSNFICYLLFYPTMSQPTP